MTRPPIVIVALPDRKTSKDNLASWKPGLTPGTGLLTIHTARGSQGYTVKEFANGWDGRSFHLAKDGDDESYDVYVGRNGQDHQCSCAAHAYGNGRACKHVLACRAVIEHEAIWGSRAELANPEQDAAPAPRDWSRVEAEFA